MFVALTGLLTLLDPDTLDSDGHSGPRLWLPSTLPTAHSSKDPFANVLHNRLLLARLNSVNVNRRIRSNVCAENATHTERRYSSERKPANPWYRSCRLPGKGHHLVFEHPGLPILERAEKPACLDKEQKILPEYGRTPFENRLREGGAAS